MSDNFKYDGFSFSPDSARPVKLYDLIPDADTTVIQALELKVTYSVATLSAKAKSVDGCYEVKRTHHFDAIVSRKVIRNPTKLRAKLLVQARNHFNMHYGRPVVQPHFFALPESIAITNVNVLGLKQYFYTDAEIDRIQRLMSLP